MKTMKPEGIKDELKGVLRMSFRCGFAAGVNYAIKGGDVSDRGIFEKNIEKITDEYEVEAFKNLD